MLNLFPRIEKCEASCLRLFQPWLSDVMGFPSNMGPPDKHDMTQ